MTLSLALPALAQALYKCPDPVSGVVKYSQTPCTVTGGGEVVNVKPIPRASGNSSPPAPSEEINDLQQRVRLMDLDRRLRETNREIDRLESQISGYRSAMNDEMARLRNKKQFANNNLAGATWEQSISDEMSAMSSKYDALIRSNQSRIEGLRKEADRLREEKMAESQPPKATL